MAALPESVDGLQLRRAQRAPERVGALEGILAEACELAKRLAIGNVVQT